MEVSMPEAVCYFKSDLERIPDSPEVPIDSRGCDAMLVHITLSHQYDYLLTTPRLILAFKVASTLLYRPIDMSIIVGFYCFAGR